MSGVDAMKPILLPAMLLLCLSAFADDVPSFNTEFQDVPPKYVFINGKSSGISYEIMTYVERKSGYRFAYEERLVPLSRVGKNMETGAMDIQFGMQKTQERERTMVFGPKLYDVRIVGVMRIGDAHSFATLSDIVRAKATVLTPNGTGTAAALRMVPGLILDDGARTAESNLEKLRGGRGEIFVYHNLTVNYLLSFPENGGYFKKVPIDFEGREGFVDVAQYLVYAKGFPEEARARIDRIIAEATANGELARITEKYLK